jgi:hypothetical protein
MVGNGSDAADVGANKKRRFHKFKRLGANEGHCSVATADEEIAARCYGDCSDAERKVLLGTNMLEQLVTKRNVKNVSRSGSAVTRVVVVVDVDALDGAHEHAEVAIRRPKLAVGKVYIPHTNVLFAGGNESGFRMVQELDDGGGLVVGGGSAHRGARGKVPDDNVPVVLTAESSEKSLSRRKRKLLNFNFVEFAAPNDLKSG